VAVRGGYGIFFTEFGSNLVLAESVHRPSLPFQPDGFGWCRFRQPVPTQRAAELACLRDLAWLWSPIHIIRTSYMQQYTSPCNMNSAQLPPEAGYVGTLGPQATQFSGIGTNHFVVP